MLTCWDEYRPANEKLKEITKYGEAGIVATSSMAVVSFYKALTLSALAYVPAVSRR